MKYELIFLPDLVKDLQQGFDWYETHLTGLGKRFLDEVESVLEKIKSNPEMFPVIKRNIRRSLLHKFPYGIFFVLEKEKNIIHINTVLHLKRDIKI